MASGGTDRGRSPACSKIALGLVLCGLVLGALWASALIGLGIDLMVRLIPWVPR